MHASIELGLGCGLVSCCFVPGAAGLARLRLRANSDEDDRTAATFAAPETNGGRGGGGEEEGEGAVTASVCLPRAVAPDIVPVILAFLYTDRLVQEPAFGLDSFAEDYLDPGVEGDLSMSTAAVETERRRPRGRSDFRGDIREVVIISETGGDDHQRNGVPSKVGTNRRFCFGISTP